MLPRFQSWRDRITYLIAEAQLLVGALAVTAGLLLIFWEPSLPSIPPWAVSLIAAVLILGPFLWMVAMKIVDWLRVRNDVVVYEIDGSRDVRKKYYVPPELWRDKTVEGPPPKPCNDGSAWEVREFEWLDDIGELRVRGLWMAELQDSKLVAKKAMFEDMHNVLVERFMDLVRLRGRIDRMGVEIQEATMNEITEAAERATMLDQDAVKDAYEDAREDVTVDDIEEEIKDVNEYIEDAPQPVSVEEHQPAATDGGTER